MKRFYNILVLCVCLSLILVPVLPLGAEEKNDNTALSGPSDGLTSTEALPVIRYQGTLITDAEGTKYVGDLVYGVPDGKGTFYYPEGKRFCLPTALPGGPTEQTYTKCFSSGKEYVGEVKNGVREGHGVLTFYTGGKYTGEFWNNAMNGKGVMINANGVKYEGDFKDNAPDGQGTVTFPDGRKYEGQVVENKMQGQGTMTFPDGRKYVGHFEKSMMSGEGVMTYPDGRVEKGTFQDNKFVK